MKHFDRAIKNNCIGVLNYWKFKDSFLFLNWEKGKIEKVKKPSDVKIISKEEFHKLYEERNIKEGTKREKEYGKVHETYIKLHGAGTTDKTGMWSNDFCRDINSMEGILNTYKEMCKHYGSLSLKEMQDKPMYKDVAMRNLFGGLSFHAKMKESLSDKAWEEKITQEEINNLISEFKSLPKDWTNKLKLFSEEANEFFKKTPASTEKIKIEKFDRKAVIEKEKSFLKNLSEDKVKINYNGHAPYGWGLKEEILRNFKRERDLKDKTEAEKEEYYSFNPLVGNLYKVDSKCYYCGKKISYRIHSENDVEVVSIVPEDPDDESYRSISVESTEPCKFKSRKSKTIPYELNFSTGDVVVANFFKNKDGEYLFEVPEAEKYSDKYSLQYLQGRFNIQDYYAKTFNVGYGQTGNMSADVFISKDKKKIIIGNEPSDWGKPSKGAEEFNKKFEKEYKKVGNVCMDVWRYECADKSDLKKYEGYEIVRGVEVKVIPGKYVVKHYLGNVPCEYKGKYRTYAEITLKEE